MSKNIKTVAASRKGKLVVGVDKTKQTSFLPHNVTDHIRKVKQNIKKAFN